MIGSVAYTPDISLEDTLVMQPVDTAPSPKVITFSDGLLGFSDARRFVLLGTEHPGLFWLQSLEHEPLAFLILDPFLFFDGYSVDLDPSDSAELKAGGTDEIAVLAIVTLPTSPDEPCTANLTGPIAINLRQGKGRQVILRDSGHDVRAPVDLTRQLPA